MNQNILQEIISQDYESIENRIQDGLKQKISVTNSKGVIFGLSGGVDSAVIAYLCHNARNHLVLTLQSSSETCSLPKLSDYASLSLSLFLSKILQFLPREIS